MAQPTLHIWLDGSTNVVEKALGAAATTNGRSVCCSFVGNVTGSELGEHVGVTCALRIALDMNNQGFNGSVAFHVDSDNCCLRYQPGYAGIACKFAYLRPVWQLNQSRILELESRGCACRFENIDRSLNTDADALARDAMHHAIENGMTHLTNIDGTRDGDLLESLNAASSLLMSSRLRRERYAPPRHVRVGLTSDPPTLSSTVSAEDFWQKMKRRMAKQLLVTLAGVPLTRGQREVAIDLGLFRVTCDYDGREVQGGYIPVKSGEVVDIHPGSKMPGDATNRHEYYVFGWLVDSSARRTKGGWLPTIALL